MEEKAQQLGDGGGDDDAMSRMGDNKKKSKDKRWILGINYHISIDYCLLFRLLCAIKNYRVVSNFIHEQKIKNEDLFVHALPLQFVSFCSYFWLPE